MNFFIRNPAFLLLAAAAFLLTSCETRERSATVGGNTAPVRITADPERCVIVLPAKVDSVKRFAADELQRHLALITGVRPPILPAGAKAGASDFVFHVGIRLPGDARPLRPEEACCRVTPEGVYLYGDDTSRSVSGDVLDGALDVKGTRAGTLSAVYLFLEESLGVRWLEPGDEGIAYAARSPLVLPASAYGWAPVLAQRTFRMSDSGSAQARAPALYPAELVVTEEAARKESQEGLVWLRRMRLGQNHKMNYRHAFGDWWEKYGKTNPEFFALTDRGKREPIHQPGRVKMCVSNAGLAREVVARWLREGGSRANPEINVCENDGGYGFCQCPGCRALDVPMPGEAFGDHLTDRYVHFANAVLAEARKHDPDVLVMFYAYSFFNRPPRRERLLPGVVPAIVPPFPLSPSGLRAFYGGWKRAGLTRCVLRPNDFHMDTGLPMGFEESLFDRLQVALAHGAEGIDHDSIHGYWACSGMAYYVQARAVADPGKPFAYWEEEYCAAFGAAREAVRDYHRHWRRVWDTRVMDACKELADSGAASNFRPAFHRTVARYYTEADFDRTDALLQGALARPLDPASRRRVETLLLANRHGRLTFRALASFNGGEAAGLTPADSVACAGELVRFRVANRDSLRMVWPSLFYREAISCFQPLLWQELFRRASAKEMLPLVWKGRVELQGGAAFEIGQMPPWTDSARWDDFRVDRFWRPDRLEEISPALAAADASKVKGVWYALRLRVPEALRGQELQMVFGGAGADCRVYVNGKEAGKRIAEKDNWRGPFSIRIDPALSGQAEDALVVFAAVRSGYGALYRPVWLAAQPKDK